MTQQEFNDIREEIHKQTGLFFEDNKLFFMQKRVEKRMQELGLSSFSEYIMFLRFGNHNGKEMQELINLITTNETYMFREFEQLYAFAEYSIPETLRAKEAKGNRSLKIWSAGCSSGEEPYTIAIILKEIMHDFDEWDITIKATDIDTVRLDMARKAIYDARSVKDVPPAYMRHFSFLPDGYYVLSNEIKQLVDFEYLNLNDRTAMRNMRNYDFIFCRNVLIYFSDAARKMVVDSFYNSLNPGGFIFLGHSESVGRISTAFTLRRMGNHLVYQKGR